MPCRNLVGKTGSGVASTAAITDSADADSAIIDAADHDDNDVAAADNAAAEDDAAPDADAAEKYKMKSIQYIVIIDKRELSTNTPFIGNIIFPIIKRFTWKIRKMNQNHSTGLKP